METSIAVELACSFFKFHLGVPNVVPILRHVPVEKSTGFKLIRFLE